MVSARSVHSNSIFPKVSAYPSVTCAKPGGWMEVNVWNALMAILYLMETAF